MGKLIIRIGFEHIVIKHLSRNLVKHPHVGRILFQLGIEDFANTAEILAMDFIGMTLEVECVDKSTLAW